MKQFITKILKFFLNTIEEKTNNQKQSMKIDKRKELNELDISETSKDVCFTVIFLKFNYRKFMDGDCSFAICNNCRNL